jgi:SnoaL-like protein
MLVSSILIILFALKTYAMTTQDIATRLVEMCRNGKIEEAKEELFAPDIISIEPHEGLLPKETKGMDAIRKKAALFVSKVEDFYGSTISEPIVAGDYFSLAWETDLQMKGEARKTNSELAVYKVKDGKIVSERFFY